MKATTLKNIKEDIRKFQQIVFLITKVWDGFPHYMTLYILVENAGFDGTNTYNYSHERAEKELMDISNLIREIAEYHKSYVEEYIWSEIQSIIQSNEYN